jgi:hypothetical protein
MGADVWNCSGEFSVPENSSEELLNVASVAKALS